MLTVREPPPVKSIMPELVSVAKLFVSVEALTIREPPAKSIVPELVSVEVVSVLWLPEALTVREPPVSIMIVAPGALVSVAVAVALTVRELVAKSRVPPLTFTWAAAIGPSGVKVPASAAIFNVPYEQLVVYIVPPDAP